MGKKTKKTRKKAKKKKKKANLPTQKAKQQSKEKKKGKKHGAVIKAAWIGFAASLLAAIIIGLVHVFTSGKITTLFTPEYHLEVNNLIISYETRTIDGRFINAPMLNTVVKCRNCLNKGSIDFKFGKISRYKDEELPNVSKEYILIKKHLKGRKLDVTLDIGSIILSQYPRAPYGIYRAILTVYDPSKPAEASKDIVFNYIYKEDFQDLKEALSESSTGFESIMENGGGLEISNMGKEGRYVSAYLNQEFDFKTNFCISGIFTLEFENAFDPSGFDIAVWDKWGGEKLSVVFPDGPPDTFSIRMKGEDRDDNLVLKSSNKMSIGRTTKGKTVYNYFQIWIWQHGEEHRCSLYVQQESPDFGPESCVHERIIDTSKFIGNFFKIKLKLWKAGVLRLYDFQVREVIIK